MKNFKLKIMASFMSVIMAAGIFSGCADLMHKEKNLFTNIQKTEDKKMPSWPTKGKEEIMSFSVDLLKNQYDGKNILLSPYSVFNALLMAANGADGITKEEFESVFGMTIEQANEYVHYVAYVYSGDSSIYKGTSQSVNAIWVNSKNAVQFDEEYLQKMADYFDSAVFYESFDNVAVGHINNFVNENTNGLIPQVIDGFDGSESMVLVNTQYFVGKWKNKFDSQETKDRTFTNLDGSQTEVPLMSQTVTECYIETDNGYGIVLPYYNGLFVALRPDDQTDFETFLAELDGDKVTNAIYDKADIKYVTNLLLPKFDMDSDVNLMNTVKDMGLASAFDSSADFSGMTTNANSLHLGPVIQKTTISIDEEGTTAAAATSFLTMGVHHEPETIIYNDVFFDQPFVYMILGSSGAPIFIGVVTDLG